MGCSSLAAAVSLFAFASVISFCLYGQRCIEYLFPGNNRAIFVYRLLFLIGCAAGCFTRLPLVLSLADLLNACLLIPNLTALVLLSPEVFFRDKGLVPATEMPQIIRRKHSCLSVRSSRAT